MCYCVSLDQNVHIFSLVGEKRYATEPKLIRSLKVAIDKGTDRAISGLAVLDKQLFFTRRRSSSIEIIDLTKNVICQEKLESLKDPRDLRSCNRNLCVYRPYH